MCIDARGKDNLPAGRHGARTRTRTRVRPSVSAICRLFACSQSTLEKKARTDGQLVLLSVRPLLPRTRWCRRPTDRLPTLAAGGGAAAGRLPSFSQTPSSSPSLPLWERNCVLDESESLPLDGHDLSVAARLYVDACWQPLLISPLINRLRLISGKTAYATVRSMR